MPNNDTVKTKLAPKRVIVQCAMIVALIATIIGVVTLQHHDTYTKLTIGSNHYELEVADTDAARAQGLGGRVGMARNHGMLFAFPNQGVRCFWMKDMQFPLDMIWLNAEQRVIKVERNVSPDTYPHPFCASTAQSVIELNAGEAKPLHVGQIVEL